MTVRALLEQFADRLGVAHEGVSSGDLCLDKITELKTQRRPS